MSTDDKKIESITTRVDSATKAELERRAKADDRKLSAYVARILRDHVAKPKAAKPKS